MVGAQGEHTHTKKPAFFLDPVGTCDSRALGSRKALATYGSDLTALAREGKLDPVIGRDEAGGLGDFFPYTLELLAWEAGQLTRRFSTSPQNHLLFFFCPCVFHAGTKKVFSFCRGTSSLEQKAEPPPGVLRLGVQGLRLELQAHRILRTGRLKISIHFATS